MASTDSTRKLRVLQGEAAALFTQLSHIITQHPGDWITVTSQRDLPTCFTRLILPNKAKSLLGQEYRHAVFDATQGFNLDSFAMLTGTLVKGSMLVLLLPQQFSSWQDHDSLRWNENEKPIAVPNFIEHLQQTLIKFKVVSNHESTELTELTESPLDLKEQQNTLQQLLQSDNPIMALIAKRGRGKSALAGQFTHYRNCIVTAPNKDSLNTFFRFANLSTKPETPFYAPDEPLNTNLADFPDYLIIDEAAMIPLPVLESLIKLAEAKNSHVLLTTTVDGYEGTGQGFVLKLLQNRACDFFYLDQPIRWNANDELESFSDQLLLNGTVSNVKQSDNSRESINYSLVNRLDLTSLKQIYYLLKVAHYRTTPVDLRRLFDAQNLSVWQATKGEQKIAALIAINEGDLPDELIDEVWKGTRRPKGNLVAQSLVAHAGEKLAAKLHSVRINRIAVVEDYRRQHIAQQLIQTLFDDAKTKNNDFLSVSFAYSDDNYRFWLACGFTIVHVASHKEASSGSHSIMAIKPITEQGQQLAVTLQQKLQRNWCWLKNIIDLELDIKTDLEQTLSLQDYEELCGFAHYYRPYEATYAALCRLAMQGDNRDFPISASLITHKKAESQVISEYQLTGRQALMQTLKREVVQCLNLFCKDV